MQEHTYRASIYINTPFSSFSFPDPWCSKVSRSYRNISSDNQHVPVLDKKVVKQYVGGSVGRANYCSVTFYNHRIMCLPLVFQSWLALVYNQQGLVTFLLKVTLSILLKNSNLYRNLNEVSVSSGDKCMFLLTSGKLFDTSKRWLMAIIFNILNIWCFFRTARVPWAFPIESDTGSDIPYYILRD